MAECRCVATSPAPDAFDGIFHWRADCPYLNAEEKRAVREAYGEPDEAIRRWHGSPAKPACDVCGRKLLPGDWDLDRDGPYGSFCSRAHFSTADVPPAAQCYRLGYERAQAKLEQAERERDLLAGKHAGVFVTERHHRETLAAAESALAAAQGALREAKRWIERHSERCPPCDMNYSGQNCICVEYINTLNAIDRALAAESGKPEPRAAPPALAAELSGKGEQRQMAYRCSVCGSGRIRTDDGELGACAFLECPDPMADYRREHPILGEQPEPGEAKKEEGA